jgi:hypothetical protein
MWLGLSAAIRELMDSCQYWYDQWLKTGDRTFLDTLFATTKMIAAPPITLKIG